MADEDLPVKIFVGGQTIAFRGFNGEYRLKINPKTKAVEYHQDAHRYRIGFSILSIDLLIRPSKIIKPSDGLNWRLMTNDSGNDECEHTTDIYVGSGNKKSPVGDWGSILVTTEQNPVTWWRNNGIYIINIFIILSLIILYQIFR